jgi:hypothetical protein
MLYLEDILKTMQNTVDVMIKLSSSTTYEEGYNSLTIEDCIGNHYVENWLEAIKTHGLRKEFIVDTIEVKFESYDESPQWIIRLVNEKNLITNVLERSAHEIASGIPLA